MASSANNIVLSPMNAFWRIEANHQIKAVADVADSLAGTYFTLMGTHYVWFSDGVAVDPAPAGLTSITVSYTTDGSASVIAGEIQAAVDLIADFSATVSGDVVDIYAAAVGEKSDSADVDSGVSVTICRKGKNVDLGLHEGTVSPSATPSTVPVTAHQTGVTVLADLKTGITDNTAELILLETQKSQLEEFYKIWGGSFTPGAGTKVFGMGTADVGKNMLIEAARLELVPVDSLGDELSYQYNVMASVPVPGSLDFSGEEVRKLTVTFQGYPDLRKDSRVDSVLIGDPTQTGI